MQKDKLKIYFSKIPGIAWGVALLFILFSILSPDKFFSVNNLLLIMRNACVLTICSLGMTCVILVSQIDLSVGSVLTFSGVVSAVIVSHGYSLLIAWLLALLSGMIIGTINGIFIAYLNFDYWIISFANMGIVAGLSLVLADGKTVPVNHEMFSWLGNGKIGPVYVMIYLTFFLVVALHFLLTKNKFGYQVYAVGGSQESASLSGINVSKIRLIVYILSGFFAAVSGLVLSSMGNSASPIAGSNYSFDAISAVIIGGTSFDGGKGGVLGTVMGALLLRILASGLNVFGLSANWQKTIIGFTIVLIIVLDALKEKKDKENDLRRSYND